MTKDYKIRMIATDIDGTLLNSRKEISQQNLQTIKRCIEEGILFTLSTGRPLVGIRRIAEEIGYDLPYITYNGAKIITRKSKRIIYEKHLSPFATKEIVSLAKKYKMTFIAWSNEDKLYANSFNEWVKDYQTLSNVQPILIKDYNEFYQIDIIKIIWIDEPQKVLFFQDNLKLQNEVNFFQSSPNFLEFVSCEVSKAKALEILGNYYQMNRNEIIAIGDGYNDLSMIEYAGIGVAMANAPDQVKAKADFITLSNDEDGVAFVINKYIFKGE